MDYDRFAPTAIPGPRGSRILQIGLVTLFLSALTAAGLHAQTQGGQAAPGAAAPAAPTPAQAQTPQNASQPAQANPSPTTDVGVYHLPPVHVNEVSLIFTVTDKHGRYIPNLNQSDFALLDDQRAPARVNSFHQQINLPLRVGILIDTSSSIRSRFQFERQGYFCVDSDSSPDTLLFNRTVPLKDAWAKVAKAQHTST